jgi:hypothetical protein
MKKVYIASPYTQGNKEELVLLQIQAWHVLRDMGYYPIAPLLAHHLNLYRQRPHGEWLEYDLETIKGCQVVVRLYPRDNFNVRIPSAGADLETDEAKKLGLEYYEFDSVEQMQREWKGLP